MEVSRRDLIKLLAVAAGAGLAPRRLEGADGPARLLAFEPLGNVTLLHITDAHATLRPVFYREPDSVIGIGAERGRPPFLSGAELLRAYHLAPGTVEAYAYTCLDFPALAARYGRMGGYAHLATLVKRIRAERAGRTMLLDGGDTIQGSATALWSRGEDMIRASNLLGVDVLTPHWEFTYGLERVRELFGDRERRGLFQGDFIAHNVSEVGWGDPVFQPYTLREIGGVLARDIPEDADMARLIAQVRAPHERTLGEALAVSESLLWRRGNFNGTFDEVILDALLKRADAEVAFSPGFRWGATVIPGQTITLEDVY